MFMFHSTLVMNYITWNTVVCPYPRMVADHVGLLNSCRLQLSGVVLKCLDKYRDRGFHVLDNAAEWREHVCEQDPYCGETFRRVDDRGTMRLFYGEESSLEAMDVIDDGLRWKLATRVECTLSEDEYYYSPNAGLVVTTSNCTLGEHTIV